MNHLWILWKETARDSNTSDLRVTRLDLPQISSVGGIDGVATQPYQEQRSRVTENFAHRQNLAVAHYFTYGDLV